MASMDGHDPVRRVLVLAAAVVALVGCGRPAATLPLAPTVTLAHLPTPTPFQPPVPTPSPTPLPPDQALDWLTHAIDQGAADADRQNAALAARLNAGTTLPPLADMLKQATVSNQKAAAAISALTLPPTLRYRAAFSYQAAMSACYSTQADAWEALGRAAANNDEAGQEVYQLLMKQAAARRQDATVAHDRVLVDVSLAPEGSASD